MFQIETCGKEKNHFDGDSFGWGAFVFSMPGTLAAIGIGTHVDSDYKIAPMISKWEGKVNTTNEQNNKLVTMNRQNPLNPKQIVTSFDISSSDQNSIIVRAIDPSSYDRALDLLKAQKCSIIAGKIANVGPQDKFVKKVIPVEDSSCLG